MLIITEKHGNEICHKISYQYMAMKSVTKFHISKLPVKIIPVPKLSAMKSSRGSGYKFICC